MRICELSWYSKLMSGFIGVIIWCLTGGLMMLHFWSVYSGFSSLLLGVFGFFIAPLGLVNGGVFLITGDSVEQYF